MADKSITIKGATDKELDELINRLRKENEVQGLIADIKRKSGSGYIPYDHGLEISTEKPIDDLYHAAITADKSKTIKEATDKELDALIERLRKELQVQSIVSDIKRKTASGYVPYDQGQEVSTEKPINSLYHFGILGMRWGRRKGSTKTSAKKGDTDSEDAKRKDTILKKSIREMSDKDLKDITSRLQLEKQYRDLTKKEISPGRKFVTELITNAAKETAKTYVTKYMNKGMEELMKKSSKK